MKTRIPLFLALSFLLLSVGLRAQTEIRWIGGYPNDSCNWLQPGNWDQQRVPGPDDVVVIPDLTPALACYPVIDKRLPGILALRIETGGMISIRESGHLLLDSEQGVSLGIDNEGQLENYGRITIVDPAGEPTIGAEEAYTGTGEMYLFDSEREMRIRYKPGFFAPGTFAFER